MMAQINNESICRILFGQKPVGFFFKQKLFTGRLKRKEERIVVNLGTVTPHGGTYLPYGVWCYQQKVMIMLKIR